MTDTPLTISIPSPLADEVRAAAEARGLSPEEYVRLQLTWDIELYKDSNEDLDWDEDIRRLEEPGENRPLDQAFDDLHSKVAETRAQFKNK